MMNRRKFLKQTGITAGLLTLFGIPRIIHDAILYTERELTKEELFSIGLDSLERTVMTGNILAEENPKILIKLCKDTLNKSEIVNQTERIKDEIAEYVLRKVNEFRKQPASDEKKAEARNFIDSKYQEIRQIKDSKEISFFNIRRQTLMSSGNEIIGAGDFALEELYRFHKNTSVLESLTGKEYGNSPLRRLSSTLINLAPDTSFITDAAKESGIPVEDIVAFAYIESLGREFAVGREGEINRFQLHPKYLWSNYKAALAQGNALSDYLRENTSEKTLLEDLSRNSNLNTALAVNLIKYFKDKTKTEYEWVLGYNMGLGTVRDRFSQKTRRKLENPEDVPEKDITRSKFRYYFDFLDAKKAFGQIRNQLTKQYLA